MITVPVQAETNASIDASTLESRIADLLAQMTLDEKIGQMSQMNVGADVVPSHVAAAVAAGEVGSVLNAVEPAVNAELQRIAREESRLGIPLLIGRDVIHGFHTIFPIPLGLAATWNPEIVRAGSEIAAREAAAVGVNWTFAPMIDIARDARWGRVAESLGEDPYLAAILGAEMVRGFQGDDLSDPDTIAACAKHFVGYGASESGRDYNTTNIPENELRNVYLPPFHAAVEAGAASLMASFSDIDGVPASGNRWLMRDVLRDEWGFDGVVLSDWESISQLAIHGLTAGDRDSALEAAQAGIDMEMASTTYRDHLADHIQAGRIDEATIDAMVANILRVKFRLGLFDGAEHQTIDMRSSEHRDAARRAALESLVLLANEDQSLPLDANTIEQLAVIGPLADAPFDQLGTWIFDGDPATAVTPLTTLRERFGESIEIRYVRTLATSRSRETTGFAEALEAAREADAVLLFLGEESILSGEAHSRSDLRLPGAQEALIEAISEIGKPTVLVIQAGRPLALQNVVEKVPAVLYAWHPGAEGGPAIVDVLFGDEAPSGKLPVTFPRVTGQVPMYYNHKNTGKPVSPATFITMEDLPPEAPQLSAGNTSYHLDVHYTPLFPFGHGLTYTRFSYRDLRVDQVPVPMDSSFAIEVTVENVGARAATEVVQLYLRDLVGNVTRPVRELKGFQRIHLGPGEARTVRFDLHTDDLAFYGREMTKIVEAGDFHAWVGGSSAAELRTAFTVVDR